MSEGVLPSDEKVAAVRNACPPTSVGEVRSFVRLVQYCGRFIPDLATVSEPVPCTWETEQQQALDRLKAYITDGETLANFDPVFEKSLASGTPVQSDLAGSVGARLGI